MIVVLDTTRADALSCYDDPERSGGSRARVEGPGGAAKPRPLTPNVDTLAAEGTRYTRAFATCFWTLPSHATLLTGLYPSEVGATSETNQLPAAAVTLAERLSAAGYATGAVVRNPWLSAERGFDQGFGTFVEAWRDEGDRSSFDNDAAAVTKAIAWLEQRATGEQPFFLFVNLNLPHLPYSPPAEARARWLRPSWPPERVEKLMRIDGGWGHLAGALTLDATDYAILRELYEAEVSLADSLVGRLVAALRRLGLLDHTLLIVTSDHGENIGDHGMIDHVYSMYDSTLRVPLVIRQPSLFAAGAVRDELVSLVDVAPTVLEACGVPGELGPGLASPQRVPRSEVFAENGRPLNGVRLLRQHFPGFDSARLDHRLRAVRTATRKLVWSVGLAAELYDLANDPGEIHDVAAAQATQRDLLLGELRGWSLALDSRPQGPELVGQDRDSRERLRALGYVE